MSPEEPISGAQQGHQRSCRGWEEGHLGQGGFSILNWLGTDLEFWNQFKYYQREEMKHQEAN